MKISEKFNQKIGRVIINSPILLAPVAGVTDIAFRLLCKEMGAGLTCTELISAEGMRRRQEKTLRFAKLATDEHPVAIQLFGEVPETMAEAAQIGIQLGFDIVDLNFGCPAKKVCKNGRGAALLKTPDLLGKIVEAVVKVAEKTPVTAKIRAGWDENSINAIEIAKIVEQAGASAITVHGRTKKQGFAGEADWDIIRDVKAAVKIPVIGNGDVFSPEDAYNMFAYTNCDFVMIARGAFGNPWIFMRTNEYLKTKKLLPPPSVQEKLEMAIKHFNLMLEYKGLPKAVFEIRKHIAWYVKGMKNSHHLRNKIFQLENPEEIKTELENFMTNRFHYFKEEDYC